MFLQNGSASPTERMRIDSSGNVHVGGIFGTDTKAVRLGLGSGLTQRNDDAGTYLAQAFQGGNSPSNRTIELFMDGSATFASKKAWLTNTASLHLGTGDVNTSSNRTITLRGDTGAATFFLERV